MSECGTLRRPGHLSLQKPGDQRLLGKRDS
jgi:hypothetical protein